MNTSSFAGDCWRVPGFLFCADVCKHLCLCVPTPEGMNKWHDVDPV